MAARNLEKMASIDAQLRLLAPAKVSEDDKLVEYDALLLDRFLDILQDLHGEDIRETVTFRYVLLTLITLKFWLNLEVIAKFRFSWLLHMLFDKIMILCGTHFILLLLFLTNELHFVWANAESLHSKKLRFLMVLAKSNAWPFHFSFPWLLFFFFFFNL